jgi:hypothetical protein
MRARGEDDGALFAKSAFPPEAVAIAQSVFPRQQHTSLLLHLGIGLCLLPLLRSFIFRLFFFAART